MIHSIGVDIVDISRFKKILDRWGEKFAGRILTQKELLYCNSKANKAESIAARFAVKEALIKCLSDDQQKRFKWHEVEILNTESGRPQVHLNGELARELKNRTILVSLSHTMNTAIAMIVVQ